MTTQAAARTLLDQRERELDLVMTLDKIRDTAAEPAEMLTMISNMMAERFNVDLCLVSVADRESGELELKSISHRGNRLRQMGTDELRQMAENAFKSREISVWSGVSAEQPDL